MYKRDDWTLFRVLTTLCQQAGVTSGQLRGVVVKELMDNALDVCDDARFGWTKDRGYYVQDSGPGIPGTPKEIAGLFSFGRSLASSKLERLPTRGALGNGLRVVAGAVYVSGGRLTVYTRNQRLSLMPQEDGTTAFTVEPVDYPVGTRVEVWLGPAIPDDPACFTAATFAQQMARGHSQYRGKTSPHWYDPDTFFELVRAAGDRPVRSLIAERFDGCSGAAAGRICEPFKGRAAKTLNKEEAAELLDVAQSVSAPVRAERLGYVGPRENLGTGYARDYWYLPVNGVDLPCVLEAWTAPAERDAAYVFINRTPASTKPASFIPTGPGRADRQFYGFNALTTARTGRDPLRVFINVQIPYMPVTSNGKTPNLDGLDHGIKAVIEKAAKQTKRNRPAGSKAPSQKEIILTHLAEAIDKTSGNGVYRYAQRQLYYTVRPYVLKDCGVTELDYGTFCRIIADYERESGRLTGMYRDSRGTLYHPHTGEEIPIGTLTVEEYRRPEWTFNKVLYSEKEGLFQVLRAERWPERHDCALLTSKGHASGAAKDVIDFLAGTGEDITVFCIHDADAAGTVIYQALQEETRARPERKIQIINWGLEVEEARQMGLQVEDLDRPKQRRPVASYVAPDVAEWLQVHRVELNAMDTPQLLNWLDQKIAPYETRRFGKVIPPQRVIAERLAVEAERAIREQIVEGILREADIDRLVDAALGEVRPDLDAIDETVLDDILDDFEEDRTRPWSATVRDHADRLAVPFGE